MRLVAWFIRLAGCIFMIIAAGNFGAMFIIVAFYNHDKSLNHPTSAEEALTAVRSTGEWGIALMLIGFLAWKFGVHLRKIVAGQNEREAAYQRYWNKENGANLHRKKSEETRYIAKLGGHPFG